MQALGCWFGLVPFAGWMQMNPGATSPYVNGDEAQCIRMKFAGLRASNV